MPAAFLVEGDLEKAFLENACKGAPVKKVVPNGVTVSIEVIVERILTHYRILERRGYGPIVVILDREGREMSWIEMHGKLRVLLDAGGAPSVRIGICNRKIENWILADPLTVNKDAIANVETLGGKGYIKQALGEYHET